MYVQSYFQAGLDAHQYSIWVRPNAVHGWWDPADRSSTLGSTTPGRVRRRLVEIVPHSQWYLDNGLPSSEKAVDSLVNALDSALTFGYSGLRVATDLTWVDEASWNGYLQCERAITERASDYRVLFLCLFPHTQSIQHRIRDIVTCHSFVLRMHDGGHECAQNKNV
jgi:hypothetical protein